MTDNWPNAPIPEDPEVHIVAVAADQKIDLRYLSMPGGMWQLTIKDTAYDIPTSEVPRRMSVVKTVNTQQAAAIMALMIGIGEINIRDVSSQEALKLELITKELYQIAEPVFEDVDLNLRIIP